MIGDRKAGGLWCHEVLADLSDYLDDELEASRRRQVERHLLECDVCERFGGEFTAVIQSIRAALGEPPPLSTRMEAELQARIFGEE